MLTAAILAKKAAVPVYTVRHYTRIGLLQPTRHRANNYQVYQASDAARLGFIVAAKELGFTLAEIKNILDEAENGNSPCPTVRDIIEKRLRENREKIKKLEKLQLKMENAKKQWAEMENSMPNGHSVCHLIESVAESKKYA